MDDEGKFQMLRTTVAIAALGLALAIAPPRAWAQPVARTTTPSAVQKPLDRAQLYDTVVSRIQARFWDPAQLKSAPFADEVVSAREGVIQAPTDADAIDRINALIDTTRASHFRLYTPDELSYYILLDILPNGPGVLELTQRRFWGARPNFPGIGAFTAEIGGKNFIDGIMDGSPAERAGLRIGDEIVGVDGAPYHQIRAFRGKLGTIAKISVRRVAEGPVEAIDIAVLPIVPSLAFDQATQASARIIQHTGRRIGYMRIWAFTNSASVINAMARLTPGGRLTRSQATRSDLDPERSGSSATTYASPFGSLTDEPLDGMIVDVRGKIGGADLSNTVLALLDGTFQAQSYGAPFAFRSPRQQRGSQRPGEVRNPSFRGKTVLLTDHHTRSAGEMVSYSFRYARMGEIVGTTTAGHVLAAGIDVVPGDLVLSIPVSRPETGGAFLEGKGVAPDIVVERPLPYSGGADPVLEAGLKRLAEMLAR